MDETKWMVLKIKHGADDVREGGVLGANGDV